jgi:hypothetical protein
MPSCGTPLGRRLSLIASPLSNLLTSPTFTGLLLRNSYCVVTEAQRTYITSTLVKPSELDLSETKTGTPAKLRHQPRPKDTRTLPAYPFPTFLALITSWNLDWTLNSFLDQSLHTALLDRQPVIIHQTITSSD